MTLHSAYAHIDARVSCTSPEGAEPQLQCDVRYLGKCAFDGPMRNLWAGKRNSINFGETYYYTQPLLESRNEELAWVNSTVFLAMGSVRLQDDGNIEVVYKIFKVG
jgi:hypothetical protein